MIFFLRPEISKRDGDTWNEFYTRAFNVISKFKPKKLIRIDSLDSTIIGNQESKKDVLIYFLMPKGKKNLKLKKEVQKAKEKGMKIHPIAIEEDNRFPGEGLEEIQSFDLVAEKRSRNLNDENLGALGGYFAREVIISNFPSFFHKKLNIFLSHRRSDGEEEAFKFKDSGHPEKERVFIDIYNVKSGENAQEIIEKELKEIADVLILVQTKESTKSQYQLLEIKRALEYGTPIVWVTLGLDKDEYKNLNLHPVGKPHIEIESFNAENIAEITNYAFELISLKRQRLLDNILLRLEEFRQDGIKWEELCDINNLYQVEVVNQLPITNTQKKTVQILKFLCRNYSDKDYTRFETYVKGREFDNGNIFATGGEEKTIKNVEVLTYSNFFNKDDCKKIEGDIIISGSFPDNIGFKCQQNIIDAVSALVDGILARGGRIIFGSHPTFQGLILEKAKHYNSKDSKKVKLYVSKLFQGKYDIDYFRKNSDVIEVDKVEGKKFSESLKKSLTSMRRAMINNDKSILGMICIGGKELENSKTDIPGVDEEIGIANEMKIPVFAIGSAGGRCETLLDNEEIINPILDNEKRDEVTCGDNFRLISKIILDELSEK